ncbi:MAG: nucleoside hydrolase, partial [Pseudomonadota bacterium]|nr:nucleoside hydrolase [Pseudomonadota bacterium]
NTLGGFVKESAQFYMDFYSQNREDRVCFFHDAFPIAHLRHPELFELTEGHVRVGTGTLDRGQTVVAPKGTTPSPLWNEANTIKVATKVDHKKLEQLFIDTYAL